LVGFVSSKCGAQRYCIRAFLKVEVVMSGTQRSIDYRQRDGCHSYGVRDEDRTAETRRENISRNDFLQNDFLKTTELSLAVSRGGSRRSKSALQDMGESSSKPELRAPMQLTILVADDHPMVREGLVTVINRQSDMRVVAEAANGREAVEKFVELRPDISLLDLRMPVMDGIEAAMSIYEHASAARLVIVTSYESEEDIYRALQAGAQGYVLKDAPVEDLINCIYTVLDGKTWIPPVVGAKLAKRVTERSLTTREMEVIRALAKGKSNKEIGVALNISEGTVKVHVTHMLEKLKVTGRTEAIGAAVKRGLVTMD
jgi:two-component system NarL family response regulator